MLRPRRLWPRTVFTIDRLAKVHDQMEENRKESAGHRDTDTGLVDATTRGVPTTDRDQRQLQTGGLAHETRDGVDFNNRKI